ncbi:uncharacterized protein LOC127739402 [Mytilus californianus]|uniref:uncharacterized protein LOC127739402 n=1 Tax=Mytilus californianus TaxID=6549 RepID=UPI0022459FDB|nr:uncharacterized protein LOC127739402 [Mytilus californianus]
MFGNSTSNMTQLSVIEMSDSSTSTLSETQSTVLNNDRSTRIYTKSKTATADSSVTTVSHTQSSVTTAGMRPKRLLCSCQKRFVNTKWHFLDGKDISDAELRQLVLEDFDANIKPLIAVKKKNLSKAIRKRTSAENRRKSAQSVGSGLSVLLIVPVALIIAADLSRCFCSIRKNYHRNKTTKKCKKSGLSNTTIIIENEIFDHDAFYAVSGRAQQSKGLGNKPLDHHPRDVCDIHIKSVRSHARHVNNVYDKSEIEDKTELSFSTNRQNQSVNRKRVVFSSDEANPKCDSKTADYKQRVTLTKKQKTSPKKII